MQRRTSWSEGFWLQGRQMTLKQSPSIEEIAPETPATSEALIVSRKGGAGGVCGTSGSNTPPYKELEKSPSLAEVQEAEREEHASALRFVLDRACAAETLVEDILDLVAGFNPDAVGAWRDQSAIAWQRILDGDCDPSEVSQRSLYQTRFEILEAVMVRAGQPYAAAEIVDFADARAKAAVRQTKPH